MLHRLLAGGVAGLLLTGASLAMAASTSPLDPDVAVLLADWTGPDGGLVPFDKVKVKALGPALEEAMRRDQTEIDAIAADKAKPTFANTIVPFERSGRAL
jgi:peptidyl-dipeptidase Dcp